LIIILNYITLWLPRFQVHALADIITVQSVVRRWKTIRYLASVRVQCLVRIFLSKKRFSEARAFHYLLTRNVSATKIQARWRSYRAQVQMLIAIVNIIVIQVNRQASRTQCRHVNGYFRSNINFLLIYTFNAQSVWRRRSVLRLYKPLLNRIKLARERKLNRSATKIQSAWRGFVVFSNYVSNFSLLRLIRVYIMSHTNTTDITGSTVAIMISMQVINKAAVKIQSAWRGFVVFSSFVSLFLLSQFCCINAIHRSTYLHWMPFSSSFAMKSKQPSPSNHVGDDIINPPTILSSILR
jgi:hypothetical protein